MDLQEERIVCPGLENEDNDIEVSLRPRTIDDYIGQEKVKENMKIFIEAAKKRGESLDHTLFSQNLLWNFRWAECHTDTILAQSH